MRNPRDPYESASEPYRQLREALNAAHGIGGPDDDDPIVVISPHLPWWRVLAARARPASRRAVAWARGLFTLTLAGVLSLVIYAALFGH